MERKDRRSKEAFKVKKSYNMRFKSDFAVKPQNRLRWHDIKGWEKVVLWFDGIREPAEGSNYW